MEIDSSIDRRLFLGAAGALTLTAPSALSQETKAETKAEPKPMDATSKRLSDTVAEFVVGFDASTLPPLALERVRLAFIDTLAVMLAGNREEGTGIVCEMVQQEGAGPQGVGSRPVVQDLAAACGACQRRRSPHHGLRHVLAARPADFADRPGAAAARREHRGDARGGDGGVHRRIRGVPEACTRR